MANTNNSNNIDFNDPRILSYVKQLGPLISNQLNSPSSSKSSSAATVTNKIYKSPAQVYNTVMTPTFDDILSSSKRLAYDSYYRKWSDLIAAASSSSAEQGTIRFEDVPWPILITVKSPTEYDKYFDRSVYTRYISSIEYFNLTETEDLLLSRYFEESKEYLSPYFPDKFCRDVKEFHFRVWHPDTIKQYLFDRVLPVELYNVHRIYTRVQKFLYGKNGFKTVIGYNYHPQATSSR